VKDLREHIRAYLDSHDFMTIPLIEDDYDDLRDMVAMEKSPDGTDATELVWVKR
jgi:hypothetical protein